MAARCAGARRCARRCVSARTSFVTMPPGSSLLLLGVCRLTRLRPSTSTRCTSEPVRGQVSTARAWLLHSARARHARTRGAGARCRPFPRHARVPRGTR